MATAPALSRQSYIDASLQLVADIGVEKLSMRKVANHLGVSAMAIYKYFPNKEELLTAALDEFITRSDVFPKEDMPWDQWIDYLGRRMYEALCSEMSWVPLLGSIRLGTRAASVVDAFVEKLTSAGFTVEQATMANFAVNQIMIGAVCTRSSIDSQLQDRTDKSDTLTPMTMSYLQQADHQRLRTAPELDKLFKLDQIDIGLPMIIEALRVQLAQNQNH